MPINRRMDKENVVHIHNGVLCSRENNGIMKFAGKWMELENVILSEVDIRYKTKKNQTATHSPKDSRKQQGNGVVVFFSLSLSIPVLDCHHTWCRCGIPSDFYCATQT
ncbi:hypothetical protein STEG23_022532, partial [Scotinomys teguina]